MPRGLLYAIAENNTGMRNEALAKVMENPKFPFRIANVKQIKAVDAVTPANVPIKRSFFEIWTISGFIITVAVRKIAANMHRTKTNPREVLTFFSEILELSPSKVNPIIDKVR